MMQTHVSFLDHLRGWLVLLLATSLWLYANYKLLQAIGFEPHSDGSPHHLLHLALLGAMVWFEMVLGTWVAELSGAEWISGLRNNMLCKVVWNFCPIAVLILTAAAALAFGTCVHGECHPGKWVKASPSAFQADLDRVETILLACTFALRGYAWAMHHAEVQHAQSSSKRKVPK